LNLAYSGVEFAVALAIGSVSLLADSIDFLEDAPVNLLIAFALGWTATDVIGLKITIHSKTHDSAKPERHALDISHPLESNQKSAHPGHTSRIVSEGD
jgi:hypothetical protein